MKKLFEPTISCEEKQPDWIYKPSDDIKWLERGAGDGTTFEGEAFDVIANCFSRSIKHKHAFLKVSNGAKYILEASREIVCAFERGNKLLLFGNGGSASDAQHLAAEFVNRFKLERRALPAIALTTDGSVLTSISNDRSYDIVFAKQISALGCKGDVAIGITTSGKSPSIINGLVAAKEFGLTTILFGGGMMEVSQPHFPGLADVYLWVRSTDTPRIQEVHITIGHTICALVDWHYSGEVDLCKSRMTNKKTKSQK